MNSVTSSQTSSFCRTLRIAFDSADHSLSPICLLSPVNCIMPLYSSYPSAEFFTSSLFSVCCWCWHVPPKFLCVPVLSFLLSLVRHLIFTSRFQENDSQVYMSSHDASLWFQRRWAHSSSHVCTIGVSKTACHSLPFCLACLLLIPISAKLIPYVSQAREPKDTLN